MNPVAGAALHRHGLRGHGIGIAVIDSGVTAPGAFGDRLVIGPDFTVDGATADEGRDRTGHGTHLAAIAASDQVGVAPGAHVVSLKVAHEGGATDVDAVIAAIDWSVAHRHELAIGVVLLAFGVDQLPVGHEDPLAAAVRRAVAAGVVVVTSAGNQGEASLPTPAHLDEVLTVGAAECIDGRWAICDFTTTGAGSTRPDLLAPGRSVVSALAPGSEAVDLAPETSFVGDAHVKSSGSSQAAAVVAGAAALLLEADRSLTPAEIGRILTVSARRIDDPAAGAGIVDLDAAIACLAAGLFHGPVAAPVPAGAWSGLEWSGHRWSGLEWSGHRWSGHRWSGLEWSGHRWSGHRWSGLEWSGHRWSGLEWSGHRWSGHRWSGLEWSGHRWSGHRWSGLEWSGHRWSGHRWSGLEWSGLEWSGHRWSGLEWSGHRWSGHRWSGLEWSGLEWSGHRWSGHRWSGLEWSGLEWSGHRWSGHRWSGHRWSGLEWSGLEWSGHRWSGHRWS